MSIKFNFTCSLVLNLDWKEHFRTTYLFSSVQSLSRVWLFATPCIAALQASLSITNSRSSPRLMCIVSVMPSSRLILCRPLLLQPPIPPSIRVFSNESTLHMRWPKYWSFSLSNEQSPCSWRDSQESSLTPQFKSISSSVLSFLHRLQVRGGGTTLRRSAGIGRKKCDIKRIKQEV